jgi:hypothetical protein
MGGENYKRKDVLYVHMPCCGHCETDFTDWSEAIRGAPDTNAPQVWTCPECDAVLGVSTGRPG